MRRYIYLLIALALASVGMVSCDKLPENGKLDGMWQLTAIDYRGTSIGDSSVVLQDYKIYWSVQLKLLQINCVTDYLALHGVSDRLMCRFSHSGDSLLLTHVYANLRDRDSLVADADTRQYQVIGIDGNQASFAVESLTDDHMQLQSDFARLYFRKY